eukprot:CAMPEP_0117744430 /NCGR_PEP_ID=MMETSP0947-20121206/6752_1 /TAXON_ID=44440 /ORGANISM="Chattonella subsalsa, Strain CCMP2191" /LENGTH=187 /DNA_ID=CAMNT_0005561373 /DNA_START=139 /DNA_END=698 /DNA_ORIENTATION=+
MIDVANDTIPLKRAPCSHLQKTSMNSSISRQREDNSVQWPWYNEKIKKPANETVLHPLFDEVILCVILVNAIFQTLDDPTTETTPTYIKVAEYIFTAVFTLELILKNLAWGTRKYFRSTWNVIDAVVVVETLVSLSTTSSNFIGVLRLLRILRPLRTVKRFPSLQRMIQAIFHSLPHLIYIMLLFLL